MALNTLPKGGIADDAVDNTKLDLTSNYAFTGTITGTPLAGTGNGCYSRPNNSGSWSSTQSISAGSFTLITAWENQTTIGSGVSYSNGVITVTRAGMYFVHCHIESSTASNTGQVNKLTLEGSNNFSAGGRMEIANLQCYTDLGANLRMSGAMIISCDASDTIEWRFRHDNGPSTVAIRNGSFSVMELTNNIS